MKLPRGIRLRGGKFHVDVSRKDAGRYTGTFDSLAEAEAKRAEWRAALLRGKAPAKELPKGRHGWTIEQALKKTFEVAWGGSKSEHGFEKLANQITEYWGKTRELGSIDTAALDKWVSDLKEIGNSDGTINRKLAALSKLFSVAVPRGGVAFRPKFPRRKEYNGRVRFLSNEEERRALDLLVQWGLEETHDAVVILLDTGLRAGELMRLTPQDVDLKLNRVTVWGAKNNDNRSIPLTLRAHAILKHRIEQHPSGKLFPSGYWRLRMDWDRLREKMGLTEDKQFVLHVLRHTFVSRLVQRGVGLPIVGRLAGHKSLQVTMRYAHLAPGDLDRAIEKLEV